MIRLYPEQLAAHLVDELRSRYLLSGNEPLLLQESQDAIRQQASEQGFLEHYTFTLDAQLQWQDVFALCQSLSLFSNRQILQLHVGDNGINTAIGEQLVRLSEQLHPDILLILRMPKLSKAQENSAWFKALSPGSAYIQCQTPEQHQLPHWVSKRARQMQLTIDEQAIQLLCYCYEGNLLALSQSLQRLALLYPNSPLTLHRVEQAVNHAAHFTPYHWLDALLAGKSKRAWHILRQLRLEESEPLILLRTLQRELLLLLQLKRKSHHFPLRTLFDQHKVWQNRRPLLSQALQRLSSRQLGQAITLLTRLELTLKQEYGQSIWEGLETLSLLLCGKPLPESMLDA